MKLSEMLQVRKAIKHLEANQCEWEDAMVILHRLAGWQYTDWRTVKGKHVDVIEAAAQARPMCRDCADLAADGICPNSGRPCRTAQPNTKLKDGQ